MNLDLLENILQQVRAGKLPVDKALQELSTWGYLDLGFAKLDLDRQRRVGFPEVVYGKGKTVDQIIEIVKSLYQHHSMAVVTKVNEDIASSLTSCQLPVKYYHQAKIILVGEPRPVKSPPAVAVITGGTADIPVAEEAAVICEIYGNEVVRIYDAGVAGIHRLINNLEKINQAGIIIVVAGMEGALGSIVGGLTPRPVIAVPTSVGYGANFHGLAALLTMLNSCAPGVAVVNIDNGFGAGVFAAMVNQGLVK
ncbi:MAG: 1-(5-phosphoribosyl)-5-amino-4-imidazole-carboxylate carboxylase [Desulfuromonas sp. SDB]|nr:MAG: 1-(5-phosphoribosyl)-5-amino-4-imidazole-carboxylate carboxylase [Desulfuromonas sp. SDB]